MDLYDLKCFLAVVETGGITQAAKKLNCVQPNVTAHIKKLEDQLGVQLFYRESRKVILTAQGRELIGSAKQLIKLAHDTETKFARQHTSGVLTLGVTQTAATAWLPRILKAFIDEYPDVEINVHSLFVETMTAQLLNHELDCVLTDLSIEHPLLHYRFSQSQRLMLVHAVDFPESWQDGVTVLSFSRESHYRAILLDHLRCRKVPMLRELTLKGMDAVLACLVGGLGISLLPESVTRLPYIAPHIKAIPLVEVEGRVGILTHVRNVETAAQRAFVSLAQEIISQA